MAKGQTAEETYAAGWEYVLKQQTDTGLSLIDRAVFFKPDLLSNKDCFVLGDTLFFQSKFELADIYYTKGYELSYIDSINDEMLIKMAGSAYFIHKYETSMKYLKKSKNKTSYNYNYYMFVDLWSLKVYDSSLYYLKTLLPDSVYYHTLEKKVHHIDKISPQKALIMSLFIPGLGQAYGHDIKNALNSLAINSLFVYAMVRTVKRYSWLEMVMGVLPWWVRYYRGGAVHAKDITYKYKNEKARKLLLEVNGYLLKGV
ncbi:MAG: hypothetical protein SGJ10_06275 [Bacteroidota bacterium]|nr:hypothetical protein [Bacteroidota bacterium]